MEITKTILKYVAIAAGVYCFAGGIATVSEEYSKKHRIESAICKN